LLLKRRPVALHELTRRNYRKREKKEKVTERKRKKKTRTLGKKFVGLNVEMCGNKIKGETA